MWIKKGVKLLNETEGVGDVIERQSIYVLSIRLTLNKGETVKTPDRCMSQTFDENLKVFEDGYLQSRVRIDRENLIAGIFYAVEGMKIGGYRKVSIAPHLAYREKGVPGIIPENAKIIAEIKVIKKLDQ